MYVLQISIWYFMVAAAVITLYYTGPKGYMEENG
jgi:hypothetical protein